MSKGGRATREEGHFWGDNHSLTRNLGRILIWSDRKINQKKGNIVKGSEGPPQRVKASWSGRVKALGQNERRRFFLGEGASYWHQPGRSRDGAW